MYPPLLCIGASFTSNDPHCHLGYWNRSLWKWQIVALETLDCGVISREVRRQFRGKVQDLKTGRMTGIYNPDFFTEHGVAGLELADSSEPATSGATGGYELAVAGSEGGGGAGKILGSRDFARYYKQNHRPESRNKQTHLAALQQRQGSPSL